MNRSAREAEERENQAIHKGETLPTEKRFDSNCITPGTSAYIGTNNSSFCAVYHEMRESYHVQGNMLKHVSSCLISNSNSSRGDNPLCDLFTLLPAEQKNGCVCSNSKSVHCKISLSTPHMDRAVTTVFIFVVVINWLEVLHPSHRNKSYWIYSSQPVSWLVYQTQQNRNNNYYSYNCFTAPWTLSRTTWVSQYQEDKTSLDLLEQKIVSCSSISWAICKSASRGRQISCQQPSTQFLQAGCPFCHPTNITKALKAQQKQETQKWPTTQNTKLC